jgi:hypothetical protein
MKNMRVCIVKPLVASLLLAIQPALAADKELLDILLGNGAITQDQYEHLLQKDALSASDLVAESEAESQLPVVKLLELERRLAENEMELDQILDRNVGVPVQGSWTDSFQLRGYVQNRHTTLLGGDQGINLWSDRSVGDASSLADADKNFLIRRARLVFFGDVGERLSFYIQPDLASSAGTTGNVAQLRDAYGDIYLTTDRVHRVRVGQSKVPFGFENLQSSQNRLALDRNDALNSAVRDERDLGAFYYYTPLDIQARFREISSLGLKHSGNYGMFGLGFYNGQGANRSDRNDNHHVVARFSFPWKFSDGQFFEAGVQAYNGQYVPSTGAYRGIDDVSRTPIIPGQHRTGFKDQRVGVSAMWYPQPFGLQAEWNWGETPGLDMASNTIVQEKLDGGYVQAMFQIDNKLGTFIPFVKWQYFRGANKAETNAPLNNVNDWELGLEWQIASEVELVAVWHRMNRNNLVTGNRSGRPDYALFDTDALRIQLQYNY